MVRNECPNVHIFAVDCLDLLVRPGYRHTWKFCARALCRQHVSVSAISAKCVRSFVHWHEECDVFRTDGEQHVQPIVNLLFRRERRSPRRSRCVSVQNLPPATTVHPAAAAASCDAEPWAYTHGPRPPQSTHTCGHRCCSHLRPSYLEQGRRHGFKGGGDNFASGASEKIFLTPHLTTTWGVQK